MSDYTDTIEKFLKGEMTHKEEMHFYNHLKTNTKMHLQAYIITMLIKFANKSL